MRKYLTYFLVIFGIVACTKEARTTNRTDSRVLTLEKTEYTVGAGESTFSIKASANFSIVSVLSEKWITETGPLTFKAEANPKASERTCIIRIQDATDRYFYKEVTVKQEANPEEKNVLSIVDKNATPQTKALLANLWAITGRGWMFGHHDDLWYGRYWYNEPGGSDTKAVCGDYPGVFSVDVGPIMDNRHNDVENTIRRRVILESRERGEVIVACAHLNNPKTGGDSWDNSDKTVVRDILTEGAATRTKYIGWIDNLADFALNLQDSKGELVPLILRTYRELTQSWSWWGSSCTTEAEFIAFWRFTVEYLRDTKGVHNFLFAVSPQMDNKYSDARGRILFRWPGDDYVDFIGMDCYQGNNDYVFSLNIQEMAKVSAEKHKPCGVTETGTESFTNSDFWTKYVLNPAGNQKISMICMWRNKYVSNESDKHYYSVYPGHPSEDNFRVMYNDPRTLFSKDLPSMYTMPEGYEIK